MVNSKKQEDNFTLQKKAIKLLKLESSNAINIDPGITTVSFIRTQNIDDVKTQLRENLTHVLKANPWLTGRIVRKKNQSLLELQYFETLSDSKIDEIFSDNQKIAINMEMPFPKICKTIMKNKALVIPSGLSLINKDKSLLKVSVSHISDNLYSIIYSLSHTIADGSTFYRIQNMLFGADKVVSLNAVRKQNYSMEAAIGKSDSAFVFYKSFIVNILLSLIFGRKPQYLAYYLNENSIKKTKAQFTGTAEVPYISTNDIISSSFFRALKARLGMLVINFRNRFKGISLDDAGNYEGVKLYDEPVYHAPEGIRKSLQGEIPYKTRLNKMPGVMERMHMRIVQVNNWASFAGGFSLAKSELHLHLPIIPSTIPLDIAVLFRPKLDRIAILILSKSKSQDFYIDNPNNPISQYLGDPVSETVFKN